METRIGTEDTLVIGEYLAFAEFVHADFILVSVVIQPSIKSFPIAISAFDAHDLHHSFNIFKIGPGEIGPTEIGPTEIGPTEIGPGEIGPGEIGPTEIGPTEIGPGEIGPGEIGPGLYGGLNTQFQALCFERKKNFRIPS